jgi:hypothetical protein
MGPGEVVVGVEVGGKARAYRLDSFQNQRGHLVNDLVGGVPVSVSYCFLTECLRVYSDPTSTAPLDVQIAGLLDDEMVVRIGGSLYFQKSGRPVDPGKTPTPIPYRLLTPTRTTWAEWTKHHPETDVYVGDRRESPALQPNLVSGPVTPAQPDSGHGAALPVPPRLRPRP